MVDGTVSRDTAEGQVRSGQNAAELERLNLAKLDELKQMIMDLLAEAKRQADSAPTRPQTVQEYTDGLRGAQVQWAVAARLHSRAEQAALALGIRTRETDLFPELYE